MAEVKSYPLVEIQFLDHCSCLDGIDEPVSTRVFGILVGETDVCYHIMHWVCEGFPTQCESHTIVKHPGIKIKRFGAILLPTLTG